jgi:hypothetical protein
MASSKMFRRTMAAATVLTALSLNAAHADDIAYFKDVQKPGGHVRSMAAKFADARACGVSGGVITGLMPAFQKCMSGRGWALDHYGPDPSTPRPRNTAVNFTDVKGDARQQPRSNAVLQADTRACGVGGKDVESASFKACMAGRGWQFAFTQRAPAPAPTSTWAWSNPGSEASSGANNDDLVRGNEDSNASNQAISDAVNAASQATADSEAAAAAQAQLDSIQANAGN